MQLPLKSYLIILLISIVYNHLLARVQAVPVFCETARFEAIFHFGIHLMIKQDNWLWLYNQTDHTFIEPPERESVLTSSEDHRLLTTLYITERPACTHWDPKYCDQIYKALDLLFIRILDTKRAIEFTTVVQMTPHGKIIRVTADQYPWNLKSDANCWPREWSEDEFNLRPSVYLPSKFESIFISHSGDSNLSAILSNNISTIDWYENLKREPLNSDVRFVGMFHLNGTVYAIGDRTLAGDYTSRVFKLEVSKDNRQRLVNTNFDVRRFFGCKNLVTTTPVTITDNIKATTELFTAIDSQTESESKDEGTNENVIIIIVIAVLTVAAVLLILVFLIAFAVTESKRTNTKAITSSQFVKDSISDNTSSVVTIESSSGRRVQPNSY